MEDKIKIPDIRTEMHDIADCLAGCPGVSPLLAARLHYLAAATKRRHYVRKAPTRRHGRPTKLQVVGYLNTHPYADNMEIGVAFGVNTGRVSEALAGFKT